VQVPHCSIPGEPMGRQMRERASAGKAGCCLWCAASARVGTTGQEQADCKRLHHRIDHAINGESSQR
jgi:hypothetical protein